MKIHEYQAKDILKRYEINIPEGFAAFDVKEAVKGYTESGFEGVMVKAQALIGGRGKAGGIKKALNADEVKEHSKALIGSKLSSYQSGGAGVPVRGVWIEKLSAFDEEYYMGIAIDRSKDLPVLIFSECGGVDIEEVARTTPEKVQRIAFNPLDPIVSDYFSAEFKLSDSAEAAREALSATAVQLAKIFIEYDCALIEINPLVRTGSDVAALDAKIVFDDNALYRHPDLEDLKDPDEEDPNEMRAKKYGLNYISLEGNVGCLVNGAGLAMATMDAIKAAGGSPANFLDVGGGATKDAVQEGFSIMLEDPNVKAIIVNIFGGIMKCDVIAQALVDASRAIELTVPIVIRLEGTNVEAGRKILEESGLALSTARAIDEAATKAVNAAKGN